MLRTLSLTLQQKTIPIRATKEVAGVLVPWEVTGYYDDFDTASRVGGFFDLSSWGHVRVQGPDAWDYVQRMSTVETRKAPPDQAMLGAFLTGRGQIISLGTFFLCPGVVDIVVSPGQAGLLVEHIEKFHFGETFETKDISSEFALFGLWRPDSLLRQELGLDQELKAMQVKKITWQGATLTLWREEKRPSLYFVQLPRTLGLEFVQWLRTFSVSLLGQRLFDYCRILAAVPEVGREVGDRDIILEANWDVAVARNKGCYPGQEVVERIFTYGDVNRKLLPVAGTAERAPTAPVALRVNGAPAGQLVSAIEIPENPAGWIGLAFIQRAYWDHKGSFDAEGQEVTLRRAEQA